MKVTDGMSRGRRILSGVLLAGVVSAFVGLLFVMNSPVQVVRVSGELSLPERDAVKVAVLQRLDGGLLGLSLDDVVEGVLALSWPREVSVRRVWPGIVDVKVTKDTFVARWGDGGVLNSGGHVVDSAGPPDESLPLIRCANANGARAMQIFQMLGQVLADTPLKVAEVEEDALGEWRVTFTNELTVSLGHEELLGRVERFSHVYRKVIEDRIGQVDHVDARYRNGVAVSWRSDNAVQVASVSKTIGVVQ
jgi:Cell division septal protein